MANAINFFNNDEEKQLLKLKTNIAGYFFDGFIRISHNHRLAITSNPVQYGADVSDHSYIEPVTLTMSIIMSDVVDGRYEKYDFESNQYLTNVFEANGKTRSIGAYNILKQLQDSRQKFDVETKLETYKNMMITSMNITDDVKTVNSLQIDLTLQQVIMATEKTVTVSKREDTTSAPTSDQIGTTPHLPASSESLVPSLMQRNLNLQVRTIERVEDKLKKFEEKMKIFEEIKAAHPNLVSAYEQTEEFKKAEEELLEAAGYLVDALNTDAETYGYTDKEKRKKLREIRETVIGFGFSDIGSKINVALRDWVQDGIGKSKGK